MLVPNGRLRVTLCFLWFFNVFTFNYLMKYLIKYWYIDDEIHQNILISAGEVT